MPTLMEAMGVGGLESGASAGPCPASGGIMNKNHAASLEDAIAIAAGVHKGQVDKSGEPYILHPLRLMMRMTSTDARIVAVLHDVVEDSRSHDQENRWSLERLRDFGFSEKIVAAIDCLTNRDGEAYDEFITRAGSNAIAAEVKLADLEDNMNMRRLRQVGPKDMERLEKYHRSWLRLRESRPPAESM
jgi:(p)ppGpp synthase/HD superfamily hydrolase